MNQAQQDQIDELLQAGQYEAALTELQRLAVWDDEAFQVAKRLKEIYAVQFQLPALIPTQNQFTQVSFADLQRFAVLNNAAYERWKQLEEFYFLSLQNDTVHQKNRLTIMEKLGLFFFLNLVFLFVLLSGFLKIEPKSEEGIAFVYHISSIWLTLAIIWLLRLKKLSGIERFSLIWLLFLSWIQTYNINSILEDNTIPAILSISYFILVNLSIISSIGGNISRYNI